MRHWARPFTHYYCDFKTETKPKVSIGSGECRVQNTSRWWEYPGGPIKAFNFAEFFLSESGVGTKETVDQHNLIPDRSAAEIAPLR